MITTYPDVPGYKAMDTGTSRAAAYAMVSKVKTLREKCLACLRGADMTADEVAELMHESILTIRPRISELKALGLIRATAERHHNSSGKLAVVWRAGGGQLVQTEMI